MVRHSVVARFFIVRSEFLAEFLYMVQGTNALQKSKSLIWLAHPTGFEPVTPAFGGQFLSS